VWEAILYFHENYNSTPSVDAVKACIETITDDNPDIIPDVLEQAYEFLDSVRDADPESFSDPELKACAKDLIHEMIDKYDVSYKLETIVQDCPAKELGDQLESLSEYRRHARVVDLNYSNFREDAERPTTIITSGLSAVDSIIGGGFTPGSVTAIMGYTGGGKTVVGVQSSIHVAKNLKHKALYLSYETPFCDNFKRFMAVSCQIPGHGETCVPEENVVWYSELKRCSDWKSVPDELKPKLEVEWFEKADENFRNIDTIGNDGGVNEIESIYLSSCDEGFRPDVIYIDQHLHLVTNYMYTLSGNASSDFRGVSQRLEIQLVGFAQHYGVAVVLLHQNTASMQGSSPMRKPKKGESAENKGFGNWFHSNMSLGVHDKNKRCWLEPFKARFNPQARSRILELNPDRYIFEDVTGLYMPGSGPDDFFVPKRNEAMSFSSLAK
jgi:RecA/RadA recombinase